MQVTATKHLKPLILSISLLAACSASEVQAETHTIELGSWGPRPTVEVYFGDKGPFTFILDTGAEGIVIDETLAKNLGLTVVGMTRMGAPGAENPPERPLYGQQTVTVNGAPVTIEMSRGLDLVSMLPGENPPVGVLGFWDIAGAFAALDLENGTLTIDTEKHLDPTQEGVVPFTADPPFPYRGFEIQVGGADVRAHIDTGAPGTVTLPAEWMDKLTFLEAPKITGKIGLVGGARDVWTGTLDGSMIVSGYREENPLVSFVEGFPGANVGSGLLSGMIVEIDLENDLIRIAPKKREAK